MSQFTSNESSRSNVLLTELLIVILFFALTAVTTVQMFVASHHKSEGNELTNRAVIIAQDWIERINGMVEPEQVLLDNGFTQDPADAEMYHLPVDEKGDYVDMQVVREQMGGGVLVNVVVSVYNTSLIKPDLPEPDPLIALKGSSYLSDQDTEMPPVKEEEPEEEFRLPTKEEVEAGLLDNEDEDFVDDEDEDDDPDFEDDDELEETFTLEGGIADALAQDGGED